MKLEPTITKLYVESDKGQSGNALTRVWNPLWGILITNFQEAEIIMVNGMTTIPLLAK